MYRQNNFADIVNLIKQSQYIASSVHSNKLIINK